MCYQSPCDPQVPLGLFYALALYVAVPFAHFYYLSVHANQSYVTPSVGPPTTNQPLQMMLWLWSPYLVASVGLGFYLTHWPEVSWPHSICLLLEYFLITNIFRSW